ncbi:cysteine--tRNA ligase [bacterium]|nr:cysteine--tRNA ligase [bacterium]
MSAGPGGPWLPVRLFNSLTREVEPVASGEPGALSMYHCGPTVYNRPTIGNWRSFLVADLLRRTLEWGGWRVFQVMNVTDVGHLQDDGDQGEDKLEAEAKAVGESPWEVASRVEGEFLADLAWIGMRRPHALPRATDHIREMVVLVEKLIAKGHAYQVGENVYFDVSSWPAYGRLSGNKVAALEAGARLEINPEKRHPADFVLWKSDPRHVMKWETAFGPNGFPGWHVECSAMAMATIGETVDIHTGGEDNVFPHHECEIAQSEAATGVPFARQWLHVRFLTIDGGKMGKSLGNAYTPADVRAKGHTPQALRLTLLRGHYRQPLDFTWKEMAAAEVQVERLGRFRDEMAERASSPDEGEEEVARVRARYAAALADDLDVPQALAAIMEGMRQLRNLGVGGAGAKAAAALMAEVEETLGILPAPAATESDSRIDALVAARESARKARDWEEADRVRGLLEAEGIEVDDTPQGPKWRRSRTYNLPPSERE